MFFMPRGRKRKTPFSARLLPGDYPPRTAKKMRGMVKRIMYRFPRESTEVEFFGEAPEFRDEVPPDEIFDEFPPLVSESRSYHRSQGVSNIIVPVVLGLAVLGVFAFAYMQKQKQQ